MMTKEKNSNNKKNQLFGTDGIRGEVGKFPLDKNSIIKLGQALGKKIDNKPCKIVFGMDTRASGTDIEKSLIIGIRQAAPQVEIQSCHIIPTPGLALVTRDGDFDYGIMITASHNPYTDNGIKIFSSSGGKLNAAVEKELEDHFFSLNLKTDYQTDLNAETSQLIPAPANLYHDFLLSHAKDLQKVSIKVVLDCANGATYEAAPQVFTKTGIQATIIHNQPDGKNINLNCGSTEPDKLIEVVLANNADLGIAFDGDGDRVLFVDGQGHMLDGDHTLYLLSKFFLQTRDDFKQNPVVVGTVMSNLGAEKAINSIGVSFVRTDVGDKYVYRELQQRDAILGGEQSGHTILRCFQPTGDGILTALLFIKALLYLKIKPDELSNEITHFPQVLRNVKVTEKRDLASWGQLQQMIKEFENLHGANSRLSIRYSGTEPLLRLMMESEQIAVIDEYLGKFEKMVMDTIGA
jgi:phosphoglucosamine mutase